MHLLTERLWRTERQAKFEELAGTNHKNKNIHMIDDAYVFGLANEKPTFQNDCSGGHFCGSC